MSAVQGEALLIVVVTVALAFVGGWLVRRATDLAWRLTLRRAHRTDRAKGRA